MIRPGKRGCGKWAVKIWYRERHQYDFDNPGFDPKTGHFSQVSHIFIFIYLFYHDAIVKSYYQWGSCSQPLTSAHIMFDVNLEETRYSTALKIRN